jgi:hypothetical protein
MQRAQALRAAAVARVDWSRIADAYATLLQSCITPRVQD